MTIISIILIIYSCILTVYTNIYGRGGDLRSIVVLGFVMRILTAVLFFIAVGFIITIGIVLLNRMKSLFPHLYKIEHKHVIIHITALSISLVIKTGVNLIYLTNVI